MASIINVINETVLKYPNRVAIADKNSHYTYIELFEKARKLGSTLNKFGTNNPIIVFADRNVDTIVHLLAVVLSGNYYIPLDVSLPMQKLQAIIDDAKPVAIIGNDSNFSIVKNLNFEGDFYTIDDSCDTMCNLPDLEENNPLYMVYTSGSTGKPKGVLKSHGAVNSFLNAFTSLFPFEEDTIIGNQTPFFFDASAKDIYLSIYNGATLEIIPSELFVLPVTLINYLNERKVNWICWVPSALCIVTQLNTFLEVKPNYLKNVFFVGEVFPIKQLNKWISEMPNTRFVNLYGSSEIAGVCCYYEIKNIIEDISVLPMGKALPNCEITLRKEGKIINNPDEVAEVFISSPALALEYYHNPEQTKTVFFVENNKRVFQSGDLARYDKDGNLCFVSRKDFQIKHMGRRIELGEIEAACDKLEDIRRCCCLYDTKRNCITLFCELNDDSILTGQDIKSLLKNMLADYMIPGKIKILEKMPLNANGKIDRQALKETFI